MAAEEHTDNLDWVRPEVAIERLQGIPGNSRATVQRKIRDGVIPSKKGTAGETLVGIPADTPPTAREQLAVAQVCIATLKKDLAGERARVQKLQISKTTSDETTAELERRIDALLGSLEDVIKDRAYLMLEVRQLMEDEEAH